MSARPADPAELFSVWRDASEALLQELLKTGRDAGLDAAVVVRIRAQADALACVAYARGAFATWPPATATSTEFPTT